MNNNFFITGTGTGIGKTFVTCALIRQLGNAGYNVHAIKPVITGWSNDDLKSDTAEILKALNLNCSNENVNYVSPWRFAAPLAPGMAAALENQPIVYDELVDKIKDYTGKSGYLLCEGAGGVMVPLTDTKTTLDLMRDINFKVVLVAGTYLGAISHTLTAISALELKSIKIKAIIVNESEEGVGLTETFNELKKFTRHPMYQMRRVSKSVDNILGCLF